MTEHLYDTKRGAAAHTTFGGYIYPSDFNTDYRGKDNPKGSPIARRILSDQRFDEQCGKNIAFTYKMH